MGEIITLIKYDILMISNKLSKSKTSITTLFAIVVAVMFLMIYTYLTQSIYTLQSLEGSGFEHLVLVTPILMYISSVGMFVIARSTSSKEKNSDFLLSLPIRKTSIIYSKTLSSTIFNIILGFTFLLPTSILYYLKVDSNVMIIINTIICILLISFFSSGIGYLYNSFINKFILKFKFYRFIRLLLVILTFGAFLYVTNIFKVDVNTLRIPIISNIIDILIHSDMYSYLVLIAICIATLMFGVYIFSKTYGQSHNYTKTTNKVLKYSSNSQFTTLLRKEFINYSHSTVYVFQTIFGHIIMLSGAIALFFVNIEYLEIMVYCFVCFSLSLTCTTNSSISLEAENLWLIKSTPVKPQIVLLSKAAMNIILLLISSTISFVLLLLSNKLELSTTILLYILTISIGIFISFGGLLINLIFPKLKFSNESEVVKQSTAAIVSTLSFILLLVLPAIVLFYISFTLVPLTINTIIFTTICYVLLISIIFISVLYTKGIKLYNNL